MGFHDILMNQSVSTEDDRGLTSYIGRPVSAGVLQCQGLRTRSERQHPLRFLQQTAKPWARFARKRAGGDRQNGWIQFRKLDIQNLLGLARLQPRLLRPKLESVPHPCTLSQIVSICPLPTAPFAAPVRVFGQELLVFRFGAGIIVFQLWWYILGL
jgi:hypothetical protein